MPGFRVCFGKKQQWITNMTKANYVSEIFRLLARSYKIPGILEINFVGLFFCKHVFFGRSNVNSSFFLTSVYCYIIDGQLSLDVTAVMNALVLVLIETIRPVIVAPVPNVKFMLKSLTSLVTRRLAHRRLSSLPQVCRSNLAGGEGALRATKASEMTEKIFWRKQM